MKRLQTHFRRQQLMLAITATLCTQVSFSAEITDAELNDLRQQIAELRNQVAALQAQPVAITSQTTDTKTLSMPQPKLSFKTKAGADLNFYGFVRADASYQAKGASTMYNNISAVPLEGTAEEDKQQDRFQATATATRFGMDFKTPTAIGDVGGKIEMDFFGGSTRDQFRIRHAYLTYANWLVGQTWSNFIAPEYLPESLDAATYVGGSLQRVPIVKYTDNITDKTNFAVSVEDPKYNTRSDPDNEMRLPALVGRINHKFDNGSVISGRSFVAEKKTTEDENVSWGLGLGGKYQITPETMLKADYYHVKGDGKFLFWANSGYVLDEDNQMHSNEFDVFTVGLSHSFSPKLRSTIGYGYMKADDNNEFAELSYDDTSQNKSLWQGWVNAIYKPYTPIELGVEYVYGERETFDGQNGIDNRINMMAVYHF
ncbi:hypothetical protein SAMN05421749_1183 [Acinetobacter marinus]|uniref:DcaP-like protein n=1 Tax=Acinetobacter marinus TaxID=281375 RepID=A0A1G6PLW7_9GAMM|nr:DcaP family trimeric outer membrane transporter [Acinetobacter marinus]SDC80506.1 hypothetical protein SAMN05421749_1183 [Acinetobacter marinus]